MKKFFILTAVTSILSAPAVAVQKCVALNSATTCTYVNPGTRVSDWTSSCTNLTVTGTSMCASNSATNIGDTAETLTFSATLVNNFYCWCKMTDPAVSDWIFAWEGVTPDAGGDDYCIGTCARTCAQYFAQYPSVRNAFLDSISD